jgi:hypothetical protein
MITWQEHRVRTLAERALHRHPRVHPVRPRLVRRGGNDLSRAAGVTVASDHHGTPAQLGSSPDLHCRQEGIHVDVQEPPGQIPSRVSLGDYRLVHLPSVGSIGTRSATSSGASSSLRVHNAQWCPKGSRTMPYRSPQNISATGISTVAPISTA